MKEKILLIDTFHSIFTDLLSKAGIECVPGYHLSKEEILSQISEFSGIAIRSRFSIDKDFISRSSKLKFIARGGAGMENIDAAVAADAGIICLNAPEGNRDAVAEHAIGMLLALMNNLFRADQQVRTGSWKREDNRGHEIGGKTIGIIGFGNTGSSFAKKLSGFDAKLIAYDKYIQIDKLKFPYVRQTTLEELQEHSDIISFHVPLTVETMYMVNDNFLSANKKSIWLINTSRGKVLKTASLVNAIESGKVTGAALDVLEYESVSFEQLEEINYPEPFKYLLQSGKVLLSPHIAGWTVESNEKIAMVLAEKITCLLNPKE